MSEKLTKEAKEIKRKEARSTKQFWWCCCAPFVLIILIIIIGGIILVPNIDFLDIINSSNRSKKPANLTSALFMDSLSPDYSITKAEKTKFNNTISESFSGSKLEEVQETLSELKKDYPEGYFVIAKMNLKKKDEFKQWYNLMDKITPPDIGVIIHETTHAGGLEESCTYFVEDKCIKIQNENALYDKLFSGKKLLKYIDEPNDIDIKYLKEANQKLLTTLDEINAYIKSVRTDRVYKQDCTDPATLARQLYILTLHLKYAQNEDGQAWNALIANKGFAYTLMRLVVMAEAELDICKEEGFSNSNVEDNLKVYRGNKKYLNNYLNITKVAELKDKKLTYNELLQRGVDFVLNKF